MRYRSSSSLAIVRFALLFTALTGAGFLAPPRLLADDWPEIQGKGRRGVWDETANRHIIIRNDHEIIRASLEAPGAKPPTTNPIANRRPE